MTFGQGAVRWGWVGSLAVLAASAVLVACGGAPPSSAPAPTAPAASGTTAALAPADRKEIAVSFAILADIVSNVGGERTNVWSLIPPTSDPHHYEATPQDLVRLSKAHQMIMVGGHFEAFAERTPWRRTVREAQIPTLVVTESIDVIVRDVKIDHGDHTHDYTGGDPHFWLDPRRVIALIPVVANTLTALDPAGADYYRANAERYTAEVRKLDAEMEAAIATIPPARRKLIVQHDAYGYLAERFGFEVLGSVLSSVAEADTSAASIARLHRVIEEARVPVVFREPQINSPVFEMLARDRGVRVGVLMTDAFTPEADTYVKLMRFNVKSLVTHLR